MLVKKPITSDEGKDSKKSVPTSSPSDKITTVTAQPSMKALIAKMGGKRHNKTVTLPITLIISGSSTSAAATAQAPVVKIKPGAASEFSSLANLFDEVICDSCELIWNISSSNSNVNDVDAAVAYDPENSGAYASVEGVLQASQFDGPVQLGLTGKAVTPLAVTGTGFRRINFDFPKGPQIVDPLTPAEISTGVWSSTTVATSVFGYLKWYVNAASAGLTTTIGYYVRMHCRFRQRS